MTYCTCGHSAPFHADDGFCRLDWCKCQGFTEPKQHEGNETMKIRKAIDELERLCTEAKKRRENCDDDLVTEFIGVRTTTLLEAIALCTRIAAEEEPEPNGTHGIAGMVRELGEIRHQTFTMMRRYEEMQVNVEQAQLEFFKKRTGVTP